MWRSRPSLVWGRRRPARPARPRRPSQPQSKPRDSSRPLPVLVMDAPPLEPELVPVPLVLPVPPVLLVPPVVPAPLPPVCANAVGARDSIRLSAVILAALVMRVFIRELLIWLNLIGPPT